MDDGETDQQHQARVGTTIGGKYHLLRLLGAGGMGAVYEAENTWLQRRVAIKLMLGEMGRRPELVARFQQEAQAATRVRHPNVVDVLDIGHDPTDGSLYIVQEFLTGSDLGHLLDVRGRLAPREALEVVVPIMSALVAVHAAGVVHRDLKPDNIFVSQDPSPGAHGTVVPKLIDFGISKVAATAGRAELGLTRTGMALGTPHYMSPEQARGAKAVDHRADIWAIGAVLFSALAGRPPFDADNYNALIIDIVSAPIPRIDALAPEVPKALADVVHGALERDLSGRYASMQQFLDALLDCSALRDEGWHRRLVAVYRPANDSTSPLRDPAPAPAPTTVTVTGGGGVNRVTQTPIAWGESPAERARPARGPRTALIAVVGFAFAGAAALTIGLARRPRDVPPSASHAAARPPSASATLAAPTPLAPAAQPVAPPPPVPDLPPAPPTAARLDAPDAGAAEPSPTAADSHRGSHARSGHRSPRDGHRGTAAGAPESSRRRPSGVGRPMRGLFETP